jgi:hypothetical protein
MEIRYDPTACGVNEKLAAPVRSRVAVEGATVTTAPPGAVTDGVIIPWQIPLPVTATVTVAATECTVPMGIDPTFTVPAAGIKTVFIA